MKLLPSPKLEKNLKLMRSCSQVKIMELTEKMSKMTSRAANYIDQNPDLKALLTTEYNKKMLSQGESILSIVPTEQLVRLRIPDYKPTYETSASYDKYVRAMNKLDEVAVSLELHQRLNEILTAKRVSMDKLQAFLEKYDHPIGETVESDPIKKYYRPVAWRKKDVKPEDVERMHRDEIDTGSDDIIGATPSFSNFINAMKKRNPMVLSLTYGNVARDIAKRNNLYNEYFSEKLGKTFFPEDIEIALSKDFNGRLINTGAKLVAGAAVAAMLVSAAYSIGRSSIDTQGIVDPHDSTVVVTPNGDTPQTPVIPPAETAENPEYSHIFSNSIDIKSYETACDDFYQKTAEIYKFYTGKDVDLSSYGQANIGINTNARLFKVEKDGVTYYMSSQSQASSNYTYLEQALEESGLTYEALPVTTTTCIFKDGKSIAIVDSSGHPVVSGNLLEPTPSGGGYMYKQDARRQLEAKGIDTTGMSEGVCALYAAIENRPDSELSRALGVTDGLADTIKSTFYLTDTKYGEAKESSYAVYCYATKSAKLADNFERDNNPNYPSQAQTQNSDDKTHDDR